MTDAVGASVDLVVDGGGSTTRVGLASAAGVIDSLSTVSANPHSVGAASAVDHLAEAVRQALSIRSPGASIRTACLAMSSAADERSLAELVRVSHVLADENPELAGVNWVITNDVAPLLLDDVGELVVVVCGTGTGFAARGRDQRVARASGREYLLSDEGGGFDIGLRGLRAVVRASDGRGAATELTAAAIELAPSVDELCTAVHARTDAKVFIAEFAPLVLAVADAGDAVARAIVHDAAVELATGIAAVARRARLSPPWRVRTSGSLLVGDHDALRDEFGLVLPSAVGHDADLAPISRSPLELVAALAAAVRDRSPVVVGLQQAFPFHHGVGHALERGDTR